MFARYLREPATQEFPPAPPLPKYNPEEEAPKWWWGRIVFHVEPDRTGWTKVGDVPKENDKPDWRGIVRNNVIPLQDPGHYDFGQPIDKRYYFFDTPDYADPFKKLAWAARELFVVGGSVGVLVALYKRVPFTVKGHIYLISKVVAPIWFSGMAASATAITVANLRNNKDDYWNWALAGLAGGTVFGRNNYIMWFKATMFAVPIALGAKYINESNTHVFHKINKRVPNYYLSGASCEKGTSSGDWRFGLRGRIQDPGRDQRRYAY